MVSGCAQTVSRTYQVAADGFRSAGLALEFLYAQFRNLPGRRRVFVVMLELLGLGFGNRVIPAPKNEN
jgi:hypothetical protein